MQECSFSCRLHHANDVSHSCLWNVAIKYKFILAKRNRVEFKTSQGRNENYFQNRTYIISFLFVFRQILNEE